MSLHRKLLSALLSCAIVFTSAVSINAPSAGAEWISDPNLSDYYDSTYQSESKGYFQPEVSDYGWNSGVQTADDETPFDVFGIYEAYQAQTTLPVTTTTITTSTTTTTSNVATTSTTVTTVGQTATEQGTTTILTVPDSTTTSATTTAVPDVTTTVETQPTSFYKKSWGVDVSQWQGTINWNAVKQAGVEFAIIRAGYGSQLSQEDPMFDTNVRNAQAAGIDVGVYWYSYAKTVEGAKREAEVCYEVIKDYDFTYPIYFDIEDSSQMYLSAATISAMADTFCSTLEDKGYCVGIYSSASFLSSKFYQNVLSKYVTWVAHYGVNSPAYSGAYGMWQYSSTGYVNGISGSVDLNYSYVDYPAVIDYLKNQATVTTTVATETPTQQTTTTTAEETPAITTTLIKAVKGIDFGEEKENVDWLAMKADGINYVILHAGNGKEVDSKFVENFNSAKEAKVQVGALWYTEATSVDEILEEAEIFYDVIKDKQFEYPIYLSIQDDCIIDNNLSVEEVTEMINAFCGYFQERGFYSAIHSYQYFLETYVNPEIFDVYDVWLANYTDVKPNFVKTYGMWQFTSEGTVKGIEGNVAVNNCYRSYPTVMTYYHLNNY